MATTAVQALGSRRLDGKRAIVTGASSGLGIETARVLALAGADVIMACRSVTTAETIADELRQRLGSSDGGAGKTGRLEVRELDLADLTSVRRFADGFAAEQRPLDFLVNNAGVMATPLGRTTQGIELQLGTNHVGHFLLTTMLRPRLEASAAARVVNVSSALHARGRAARLLETLESDPTFARRKYDPFDAYGDSKLANILFTRQLQKILPPTVEAYALHPGVIPTNLTRSMGVAGSVFRAVGRFFTKTIEEGAATTIHAVVADGLASGAYLADCRVATPSKEARSDDYAARLWQATERISSAA